MTQEQEQEQEPQSPGAAGALAPCDRSRVLVVDDEDLIIRLFKTILTSELPGVSVDVAGNGAEALDSFRQNRHAVLLMDLHMPVMDGQVAFREIEKLCAANRWEMPSVVFCTGFAPPDSISRVVSGNSLHCLLSKPVPSSVMVDSIRRRLK